MILVLLWIGIGFVATAVILQIAGRFTLQTSDKRYFSQGKAHITSILIGDAAGVEPQIEFEVQGHLKKATARKLSNRDGWLKAGQEVDVWYRSQKSFLGDSWIVYIQKPDGSDPMILSVIASKILFIVSMLFFLIGIVLMGYYILKPKK